MKKTPDNQLIMFQALDGSVSIDVLYENNNVWLTQKKIAELYDVDRSVVTKHLKNIFEASELIEDSVCAKFAHTAEDGKTIKKKNRRNLKRREHRNKQWYS